jgi:hypothetical protein
VAHSPTSSCTPFDVRFCETSEMKFVFFFLLRCSNELFYTFMKPSFLHTTSLISRLISGILGSISQLLRNAQMRYIPNWLLKSVASYVAQMRMDGAMAFVDVQFPYLCRQQAWNSSEIV